MTELGEVCAGLAPGRGSDDEITLFDSTGLAIQDLAIAIGALESLRAGAVKPQTISLWCGGRRRRRSSVGPLALIVRFSDTAALAERPLEQELLSVQSAAVAAEPAARVQDAVAGNDDRDRIRAEGVAGRAGAARAARGGGHRLISRASP